jgi:hypothetical protein
MRLRSILFTLLLGGLAFPAAATASLPKVLTQNPDRPFEVRPASIEYTGDGTAVVGGDDGTSARHPGQLRWTKYTGRHGVAKGMNWINDCEPSCAEGDSDPVPVNVHVFSPKQGRFTRLTLKFTYQGRHFTDRRRIRHARSGGVSYWYYDIISMG